MGAGLVLQRTGLAVLAQLGIDKAALIFGKKLTRFLGKTSDGRIVYDLRHRELAPDFFSLGIHRHTLLELLSEKAQNLSIPIIYSFVCADVAIDGKACILTGTDGQRHRGLDLVVDASGTHSVLRDKFADIYSRRSFTYGALWGVCKAAATLPHDVLQQRFRGSSAGIGVIPIGKRPGSADEHIALHWSIRHRDAGDWRASPLDRWKEDVVSLFPEAEPLVAQFATHSNLTLADYRDIALRKFYSGRICFIGDACHSISPRLGQGANLGLVDALVLARCITHAATLDQGLATYDAMRKRHVNFYRHASRWMNVLFQSDGALAPIVRDMVFRAMTTIPWSRRQMLMTVGGMKTGIFSAIDPATLHADYPLSR
jgi:2-polyprenyl-6-methoxyphenol hydroxylase-like FAD-dependent oxidoreductase